MRKQTAIILVALAALAIAGGAWLLRPVTNVTKAIPNADERTALQAEADSACACARRLGDDPQNGACWATFERRLARYDYSTSSTACMSDSATSVCFGPFEGPGYYESCILKHRPYGACSEEEATERAEQARARGSDENGCG